MFVPLSSTRGHVYIKNAIVNATITYTIHIHGLDPMFSIENHATTSAVKYPTTDSGCWRTRRTKVLFDLDVLRPKSINFVTDITFGIPGIPDISRARCSSF